MVYTFDEAITVCENRNETLARVTSEEDQDFIYNTLFDKLPELSQDDKWLWLGATNLNATRTFEWLDGGSNLTYSNWARGEPSGEPTQRNAIVMGRKTGKWFDFDTVQKSLVLCEKKVRSVLKPNVDQHIAPVLPYSIESYSTKSHSNTTSSPIIRHIL